MGISKKFTIIFVLSLVCVLFACALVACNPSDSANNGQLPSDEEYVTVTFDTDGGSAVHAEKVKVGDRVEKPAEPLKDGYLFAGWFLDGKQYDFNLSVTSDITLVAHWTENLITVMFVVNDTVIKQLNVKYGSSLQSDDIPAVPERSGYIGAWDRQSFDNLKESLTVKAVYTRQEYDVRFVLNYEGAGTVTERTENGLITFIPERPDYVFNGWWYSDGQTSDGGYILTRRHDMKETIDEAGVVLYAEWVKEADRAEQLSAPVVSVENGVFYWEAVDGATGYTVTILQGSVEQEKSRITATHFSFPTYYSAGYYTVKICANGDGINTYNSVETSKNYAHRILTQPTNVNINDTTSVLTWTAVPNATSYTVTVNGTAVNCSDPVYDMSSYEAGTYTVTVTAKRNGWTSAETRATIKKVRLKTPAVSITTDGLMYTVTWDEVAHANSYIVKIGEKEMDTASTSWSVSCADATLWDTTEQLTFIVYAYDSNTEYLRSIGEEYKITRLWGIAVETSEGGQVNAIGDGVVRADEQCFGAPSGKTVTLVATTNGGYVWLGWYLDGKKVSEDNKLSYSFEMESAPVTYTAIWQMQAEMEIFNFSSTPTDITIFGVKDGDISAVEIPSYSGVSVQIAQDAFTKCKNLNSVTIGSGVTSIGGSAFYGCYRLVEVYNKSKLNIVAGSSDNGYVAYYAKNVYTEEGGSKLTTDENGFVFYYDGTTGYLVGYTGSENELVLPDGFVAYNGARVNAYAINGYAFYSCSGLTSVTIGNSVTSIGDYAFYGCSGLTSIAIPDSVTSIGNYAFWDCISLKSATIGNGVTSIGGSAFYGCYRLVEVYNKSKLNIVAGSSDNGYVAYYAKNVHTEEGGSKLTTDENGFVFYYDGTTGYLVGYTGSENELVLPDGFVAYNGARVNAYAINGYAFYNCSGLTSITISDSVTSIGNYAFKDCISLKSATIGNGVTSIGSDAFSDCYKLVEVYNKSNLSIVAGSSDNGYVAYYAKNVYTEEGGSKLTTDENGFVFYYDGTTGYLVGYTSDETELILPDGFVAYNGVWVNAYEINIYAFYGCSGLTSVTIGNGVTSIGYGAFEDCSGLTSITIPDSVTSIGSNAFAGCSGLTSITIPDSVTRIRDYAFWGCSGLTSIIIPDSVTSIWDYAFWGCSGLTSITIPDSVTSIGDSVFYRCSGLTSVTIGNGVTSIGDYAFENCYKLVEVYNRSKLNIIAGSSSNGYVAYYAKNVYKQEGGSKLTTDENGFVFYYDGTTGYLIGYTGDETELILPDGFVAYNGVCVNAYEINRYAFHINDSFKSVTIGNGVTSVGGDGASSGRTGLTSITIPDSVTSIGEGAFYNCSSLRSVTIGNGVTSIGSSAFEHCSGLTSVTIGNGVTSIGDDAFRNCSGLTSINIPDSVTSIGEGAFSWCSGLTSVTFENTSGWQVSTSSSFSRYTGLSSSDLSNRSTAATYLKSTYDNYYWRRV